MENGKISLGFADIQLEMTQVFVGFAIGSTQEVLVGWT